MRKFFDANLKGGGNLQLSLGSPTLSANISSPLGSFEITQNLSKSLISKDKLLIPFISKKFSESFFSIALSQSLKVFGFRLELLLFGLSFSGIKSIRKGYILLDLHYSKKLRIPVPLGIFVKIYKRRIILFGFQRSSVVTFANFLRSLKPANSYSGKGIRFKYERVLIKPGKVRQK